MNAYMNADLDWLPAFLRMVGPKPTDDFVSNGASRAPDVIAGYDLRPAAHWHDWHYDTRCEELWPRDETARYEADQFLRENLLRCELPNWIAKIYFYRVRLWGHLAFQYGKGLEPHRTLGFWLRLFFGRYVRW